MNKKYVTVAIMALLIPTSIFAADVPVMADSTVSLEEQPMTTEAAPKSTTVASKVSTTASPETNKAMRAEADESLRNNTNIVAPEAQKYMDRLQIGVRPVILKANYLDFKYPEVTSVSPAVTQKINDTILNYVTTLQNKTLKNNLKATNKTNVNLTYDVKADGNGVFSVLLKAYSMQDQAANGVTEVKGFTFNTTTGKLLSVGDFGPVSKEQVNTAIQNLPIEQKATLFPDASVEKLTGEFYATENHDVYLIFQQGVLAPMSSGTIYLPMGQLKVK